MEPCPLCLQPMLLVSYLDTCLHSYCFTCISKWFEEKQQSYVVCPMCKRPSKSMHYNFEEARFDTHHFDPSVKSFVPSKEQVLRLQFYKKSWSSVLAEAFDLSKYWRKPLFYRYNSYLENWLRRELQALMQDDNIDIVVHHILGTVNAFWKRPEYKYLSEAETAETRGKFQEAVQEAAEKFVGHRAAQFVEELERFLASGWTVEAYDEECDRLLREDQAVKDLYSWVDERIGELLPGHTEENLTFRCIKIAKLSRSADHLLELLVSEHNMFQSSEHTPLFAQEIYEKVSHETNQPKEEATVVEKGETSHARYVEEEKTLKDVITEMLNTQFPAHELSKGIEILYSLGAINKQGQLTKMGGKMAAFSVEPRIAKMIVSSERYGCSEEIITIASMMTVSDLQFCKKREGREHSDHIFMLEAYESWEETNFSTQWCEDNHVQVSSMEHARFVLKELVKVMDKLQIKLSSKRNVDSIKKCIIEGFFSSCVRLRRDGSYDTLKAPHLRKVIDPSSVLYHALPKPQWLVHTDIASRGSMSQVTEIRPTWLEEIAPHFYRLGDIREDPFNKMPKGVGQSPLPRR